MKVKYKKLHEGCCKPTRESAMAAGYDLHAYIECGSTVIHSGETVKVGTGIALEIPTGFFGAIYARSGLAVKKGIALANNVGIIDEDYRGEIIVALHNKSKEDFIVNDGDRIAQIIIQKYAEVEFVESQDLSDTDRGANGFGSSGVHDKEFRESLYLNMYRGMMNEQQNVSYK